MRTGKRVMKHRHLSIARPDGSAVAVVTLDRPDVYNALNSRLRRELADAAARLLEDDGVGALVLTGGEGSFSIGADVREEGTTYARGEVEWYTGEYARSNEWYRILSRYPKAIVVGLNGYVAGAGLQLALCGDVIIGSPSLRFWIPQVGLGLSPHIATLAKLARIIGQQRTQRLVLTGERANADDALRWGLISEVVETDQLVTRAVEIAETVARYPRIAVQVTKEAFFEATGHNSGLLALLDELKSFGMVHSMAWQENRAELLRNLARRRTRS